MSRALHTSQYPVAIIQDRYNGIYARGLWLAVASADEPVSRGSECRAMFCLFDGPSGGDTDAMMFWHEPPDWIAVGGTPDEALARLRDKGTSALAKARGQEEPR